MGNETSSESGVVEEVEQGQEESSVISPSAPGASTHYADSEALERSDAILPHGCEWTDPWAVDTPSADQDGWQFSSHFEGNFVHKEDVAKHWVRRRRWIRPFVVISEEEFGPTAQVSLAERAEQQNPPHCRHAIFVNPKSGGNLGSDLLQRFLNDQRAAGDIGVFTLIPSGPKEGLRRLTWSPESRILVCGGDGTAAWVLTAVDDYLEENKKDPDADDPLVAPACGILPLGTGNDLARVFGWGSGYGGDDPLQKVVSVLESATLQLLDRWDVEFHPRTASALATDCDCLEHQKIEKIPVSPEELLHSEEGAHWRQQKSSRNLPISSSPPSEGDGSVLSRPSGRSSHPNLDVLDLQSPGAAFDGINLQTPKNSGTSSSSPGPSLPAASLESPSPSSQNGSAAQTTPRHKVLCNYFGIGIDAEIALSFHEEREANPERFQSRLGNQAQYGLIGFEKALFTECSDLNQCVSLFVDDHLVPIRDDIEAVIVLNISSFGAGCDIWGTPMNDGFAPQSASDGLLEVVGIKGSAHLARIQLGLSWSRGIRMAQGRKVSLHTRRSLPVQVDGEPWLNPPACIRFDLRTKSRMLRCTEPL